MSIDELSIDEHTVIGPKINENSPTKVPCTITVRLGDWVATAPLEVSQAIVVFKNLLKFPDCPFVSELGNKLTSAQPSSLPEHQEKPRPENHNCPGSISPQQYQCLTRFPDRAKRLCEQYNVESIRDLSFNEASQIIETSKRAQEEKKYQ